MKGMAKRFLASLLVFIMVATSLPVTAFAQTQNDTDIVYADGNVMSVEIDDVVDENNGEDVVQDNEIESVETDVVTGQVSTAEDLENALNAQLDSIEIVADFELDRTFYVTKNTVIYASAAHTLTRAAGFAGDLFVVGESADGTACTGKVTLAFGKADKKADTLLTIDGNKENMTVDVTGSALFVCDNTQVDLKGEVAFSNHKKVGNVKSEGDAYGLSYPALAGGAVAITVEGSVMNIYGAKFVNNETNTDDATGVSYYGGNFYNFGTINVYDGLFEGGKAVRAGIFYNYRTLNVYGGEFRGNEATVGGAVYAPASTGAFTYLGKDNGLVKNSVTFADNKSTGNGGAVYNAGRMTVLDVLFDGNTAGSNGGAIYSAGKNIQTDVEGSVFKNNSAVCGGAIAVTGTSNLTKNVEAFVKNATFKDNSATESGGAVAVLDSAEVYVTHSALEGNTAATAGAVYVEGATLEMNNADLTQNQSSGSGGAILLGETATAVLNRVNATGNTAGGNGGVVYASNAALDVYNAELRGNQAKAGSAMYLYTEASGNIYNTLFIENSCLESNTGNSATVMIYNGGKEVTMQDCSFIDNTTYGAGGGLLISNKSQVNLFNITATGNTAAKGGFMYETTSGTVVNMANVSVSGNTATAGGPIIWGNTLNAKLYIDKSQYSDLDVTDELTDEYWEKAIYNKLTVYDTAIQIPAYDDYQRPSFDTSAEDEYVTKVYSARELESALRRGAKAIEIAADFKIDRTLYVGTSTEIFSTSPRTLTRAEDFDGDIFVVGETKKGKAAAEPVKLILGNETSSRKDLLVIDGNKANMEVAVKGSAIFTCKDSQTDIYSVDFVNHKKVGNEKALESKYSLSYPELAGGAVAILVSGSVMNIYGGNFSGNEVNSETSAASSAYGGGFYNFGTLNIYDGTFEKGNAVRAGVFYNYRRLNIYGGTIDNNHASLGGAIYAPSSTGAFTTIKSTEKDVLFTNNTAASGGAISNSGRMTLEKVTFDGNTATEKAGAVYSTGKNSELEVKNCSFLNNKAATGGAIYATGASELAKNVELLVKNSTFKGNEATANGGAVYVADSAQAYVAGSSFEDNTSTSSGGAIYVNGAELELNHVTATGNTTGASGGVLAAAETSTVKLNLVNASGNTAAGNGGFAYATYTTFDMYNSTIDNNSAKAGSGLYLYTSAAGGVYNSTFTNNTCAASNTGNAATVFIYTGGTEMTVQNCTFTNNVTSGLGGAMTISGKSVANVYDVVATGNSAAKGGFLYITSAGTVVNMAGVTVSGNTATVGGPIIWGNTANAKLYIDKTKFTDTDVSGELDSAYWEKAIANLLTVTDSTITIPTYEGYQNPEFDPDTPTIPGPPDLPKDPSKVSSAKELEDALKQGLPSIEIVGDFMIDRTFYITHDVNIYATEAHVLKRTSEFDGDIFVVGESAEGVPCEEQVKFSLGQADSEEKDLLTIDGNYKKATVDVKGSVIFACKNTQIDLYENLTIKNHKKVGNERALEERHGLSYPKYAGGAIAILTTGSTMNIYGGTYSNNDVNESTGTGSSYYGGGFYNFGTMNVYGGTFEKGNAYRAGIFYNYRKLNLYHGVIQNNKAAVGGAIYMPASTGSFTYIGGENDVVEPSVLFYGNTATGNGGVIYANNVISVKNAVFENNTGSEGGVIYASKTTQTIEDSTFKNNTSTANGGALFVTGMTAKEDAKDLTITNTVFMGNKATYSGGAVSLKSGVRAAFTDTTFDSNTSLATENDGNRYGGGAVFVNASPLELRDVTMTKNETGYNGGAIYLMNGTELQIFDSILSENTASSSGGAVYSIASKLTMFDNVVEKNQAASGGAMCLYTDANSYICRSAFTDNVSTNNGGAFYVYTNGEKTFLHSCTVSGNSAAKYGGGFYVSKVSDVELYNMTAENNTATYGGVVYLTTAGTTITMNGLTVSGNTATTSGPIVHGNNDNAVLNFSKINYKDSQAAGALDDAYWASVLQGKMTINELDGKVPGYAEPGNENFGYLWGATDVASADQLEKALADGKDKIRITKEFEIDRTFYVTSSTTIFATVPVKLTRAVDFGGDVFVVGENSAGEAAETEVKLTIGNSESTTKDLFVIDGNSKKVTAEVNGTVFFVTGKGSVELLTNLTATNHTKSANARAAEEKYGLANADCIGGAVAIVLPEGECIIDGAEITENVVKTSGKVVNQGGAVYNAGQMTVKSGRLYNNQALYGGAVYNTGQLEFTGGIFEKNTATSGGAVYSSAGTVTVSNTEFLTNSAKNGGAIALADDSEANITAVTTDGNAATYGGFLYSINSAFTVKDTTIAGNTAKTAGGAIYAGQGTVPAISFVTFEKNSSDDKAGAVYLGETGNEVTIENSSFINNQAAYKGGALVVENDKKTVLRNIVATKNIAENGGAVYVSNAAVEIYDSQFTDNKADNHGGALAFTACADALLNNVTATGNEAENGGAVYNAYAKVVAYACEMTDNIAVGYGGAVCTTASSAKTIIDKCNLNKNSAQYGGAIAAIKGAVVDVYNTEAKRTSSKQGGAVYLDGVHTTVTLNGLTVFENAGTSGPVIYGGKDSTLKINKTTYQDLAVVGTPSSAYWKKNIVSEGKVIEITDAVPTYPAYEKTVAPTITGAVDVSSAKELETAINAKKKAIRIVNDFAIDRTYYIASDVTIFATEQHTLTRAADFGGDFFIVGETKDGRNAFLSTDSVKFKLGNPEATTQNLLIIDGNSSNMNTTVSGSVVFVCHGAEAAFYDSVTVQNCYKEDNDKAYGDYRLSRPNRVGGPVGISAGGSIRVHGGIFQNNKVRMEDTSTEEGRNSTLGGVFYNQSNLYIYDGTFKNNEGARGGIVYNYKNMRIDGGSFVNNHATVSGGVYYSPSGAGIQLRVGANEVTENSILFAGNTAVKSGGVMCTSTHSAILIKSNTVFEDNHSLKESGGVIYTTGILTVYDTVFEGNSAAYRGGAILASRASETQTIRRVRLENCEFNGNTAPYGGALALYASSTELTQGGTVTVTDCTFEKNFAKPSNSYNVGNGGAIHADRKASLTITGSTFEKNTATGEAGAAYVMGAAKVTAKNTEFTGNTSGSHGGAFSVRSAYLTLDDVNVKHNTSGSNGGAMYAAYNSNMDINAVVKINNSEFSKNESKGNGGAVYTTKHSVEKEHTILTVDDTAFKENTAKKAGGALLFTAGAKAYMTDVTFTGNQTLSADSGDGAAVSLGSKDTTVEMDGVTFKDNKSKCNGGAVSVKSGAAFILNDAQASGNQASSLGGFLYSEGGIVTVYDSTFDKNKANNGGCMYLFTDSVTNVYNCTFNDNAATGNGGALFVYTYGTPAIIHGCVFDGNTADGAGGAAYVSGESNAKFYDTIAENNAAANGGFMYITKAGTVTDIVGLTVSKNTATEGGPIIWGNTFNATLRIDKEAYSDSDVTGTLDEAYWKSAIVNKLTVVEITDDITSYPAYESKRPKDDKEPVSKKVVPVTDVFNLAKKSSNADINSTYAKLPKLDNSSNFMSRGTTKFPNINGKTVTVDTFVYQQNEKANNCSFGEGTMIYQALEYKKAHPEEEVYIDISSYRFSVQAAVNINRNSRYFGYMRQMEDTEYDKYGFVRMSYLLITAAKMGIHVNVIGHQDAYPLSTGEPRLVEYFEERMDVPCDPAYVKGGKVSDYLRFTKSDWSLVDGRGGSDMMHTKLCAVSHYLDKDGKVHKNAVWTSSQNLDGIKSSGINAHYRLQTATIISDHEPIWRASHNYLRLVADHSDQEGIIEFQGLVNSRSTKQIDLILAGRANEIPKDEQIVYLGSKTDDVFEIYFTPFGGDIVSWDETYQPYCKYLRELYESEGPILFTWNAAEYTGKYVLGAQIEEMITAAFHKNKSPKNKIYANMESFDGYAAFEDLVVGKDIGFKSFNEQVLGKVHSKDLQFSYVKDGQRYFVCLFNSCNPHSGSMSYQSNQAVVIKETSCSDNSVFSTLARYSTVGDISMHDYGDVQKSFPSAGKDGTAYHVCKACGKKEVIGVAHRASDWIIDREPTPTASGRRHKECTVCDTIVATSTVKYKDEFRVNYSAGSGKAFAAKDVVTMSTLKSAPRTLEATIEVPKSYSGRVGTIIGNYAGSDKNQINLEVYTKGRVKVYVNNGSKSVSHIFKTDIRSDNPVHVAVTLNGKTATLYVNGVKKEAATLSISAPKAKTGFVIGGDNRKNNTNYFKGRIYGVNVFSDVRTSSELKKDAVYVIPKTSSLLYSKYFTADAASYVTEEITGRTFSKSRLISAGSLSKTPRTVEAVIKVPTSVTGRAGTIVGNYSGGKEAQMNLEVYDAGKLRLYFKDGSKTASHVFKSDIRKYGLCHIAITLDENIATLYINGSKKETAKMKIDAPAAKKSFKVGGDNRSGNTRYFKGTIYAVNLFSDMRSASEIKKDIRAVASNTAGLVYSGYYTTESNFDTIQQAGKTFTANMKTSIGDVSKAPCTLEAVVSLSESVKGRAGTIVGNYSGGSEAQMNLEVYDAGKLRLYFKDGSEKASHTFKTDIRKYGLCHIAVTMKDSTATLYINGTKKESAKLAMGAPAATENFVIGGDNRSGNTQYFKGKIYSVNLFSDVRTSSELVKDARVVVKGTSGLVYSGYMLGDNKKCDSHKAGKWITDVKATATRNGFKHKECKDCGALVLTSEILCSGKDKSIINYEKSGTTFDRGKIQVEPALESAPKTLEVEFYLPKSYSKRAGVLVGNYGDSDNAQLNLEVKENGKPYLYMKDGKTVTKCQFSTDVRANSKVSLAVTIDGKTAKLYLNGVLKETKTLTNKLVNATEGFCVGGDNRAQNTEYFKGRIYTVNLFKTVKTASQVKSDALRVNKNDKNLIYSRYFEL